MVSSCVKSFSESFTSMDGCSSLLTARLSSSLIKPQLLTSSLISASITTNFASKKCKPHRVLKVSAGSFSYHKFIHFALDETKRHALLVPSPLQAWLELIDQAPEEIDASHITCNREAQHKYLTWREEKDPGHGILKRLIGERLAKDLVRNFLFNGLDELGSKGFLDYFPEYRREDGSINEKRSIIGKSFENRPWDARGEFIGGNGGNGVVPS